MKELIENIGQGLWYLFAQLELEEAAEEGEEAVGEAGAAESQAEAAQEADTPCTMYTTSEI